jgi:hypothetical protein
MSTIQAGTTGRKSSRYLTRAELAAVLREDYGFPVSKNLLDKEAHRRTGPEPEGTWGKYVMYTLPSGLAWARKRFRKRARDD